MIATEQIEENKMCRAAPLVLGLMQIFSCVLQILVHIEESRSRITPEFFVWSMIIFSPILVLVVVRRYCFLLAVMAVPIVAIFCGRIHYGLQLLHSKPLPQMGDWAIWLNFLFAMLSLGVFAVWTFVRAVAWFGIAVSKRTAD